MVKIYNSYGKQYFGRPLNPKKDKGAIVRLNTDAIWPGEKIQTDKWRLFLNQQYTVIEVDNKSSILKGKQYKKLHNKEYYFNTSSLFIECEPTIKIYVSHTLLAGKRLNPAKLRELI